MYEELTQNENANQYEDILKKGSTNISTEVLSPCLETIMKFKSMIFSHYNSFHPRKGIE